MTSENSFGAEEFSAALKHPRFIKNLGSVGLYAAKGHEGGFAIYRDPKTKNGLKFSAPLLPKEDWRIFRSVRESTNIGSIGAFMTNSQEKFPGFLITNTIESGETDLSKVSIGEMGGVRDDLLFILHSHPRIRPGEDATPMRVDEVLMPSPTDMYSWESSMPKAPNLISAIQVVDSFVSHLFMWKRNNKDFSQRYAMLDNGAYDRRKFIGAMQASGINTAEIAFDKKQNAYLSDPETVAEELFN